MESFAVWRSFIKRCIFRWKENISIQSPHDNERCTADQLLLHKLPSVDKCEDNYINKQLHIIYSGFSPIHLFPWKKKKQPFWARKWCQNEWSRLSRSLKVGWKWVKAVRLEGNNYREQKKNPLLIIKYLGSVSAMYIIYCLGCTGNTSHMENETSRYSK